MNTMPRPEHPLPQWERSTWKNLNGEWDFSFDFGKSGVDRCFYEKKDWEKKIIVPFCPESDLSGIGYKDYMDAVWYHKTVELTEVEVKGRVLLHFGAVDYDTRVWINGTEVGRHKGGYTSFTFDITAYVQAGANDIAVYAEDDLRSGKQPHGKQSGLYYSHGCEYTRTTGIWQTVWLEFVPENYVKKARFFPNVEAGTITIEAVTVGDGSFCAEAFYEGRRCGQAETTTAGGNVVVTLPLSEVHLWEAGAGRLYDLTITFGKDTVHSYFGLRNVTISGEKVLINGKSVFQRLVLDQGFYPDGIYTASTDEALENDVKLSMAAGFNGARLHQKAFEERFHYWADRLGYITWGEAPSWGMDANGIETARNFLTEWQKVIATGGYKPYEDDINEEFSLELFGMAIMSTARIGKIKSLVGDKFEWNVAALPKVNADDKGGIAVGGSCVVMFDPDNDPAQVDATWEFVQFMVSAEEQFQFHQATGYIPVNKTVYNLPEADKWFEENPMYKVAIDCIHASNPNVQEPFDIINWEIDSVIKTHMLAFANGEETLDECHDRIVEECNERLDDYHLAND